MRLKLIIYLAFLGFVVNLSSCKKGKEEPTPQTNNSGGGISSNMPVESDKAYSKKWQVSTTSNQKVSATANAFYSFEFTPYGQYVVIDSDSNTYTGNYTYNATDNKITLANYGVITITSLTATNFSFTIYVNDLDVTYSVTASVSQVVELLNDKTDQLARSWKLVSQTNNGNETGIFLFYSNAYVIISKYGTHVLTLEGFNDMSIPQVWKWRDESQKQLCVGDVVPDCSEQPLNITIGSDNKMVVTYAASAGGTMREVYEVMQ